MHTPPRRRRLAVVRSLAISMPLLAGVLIAPRALAQTCPTEDPAIDSAKSHTIFLYFPAAADSGFPNYASGVSPAQPFDVAALNPAIGTTAQLIAEIKSVVADDYCEFNAQVKTTTTSPAAMASPPARRVTVAIGSDVNGSTSGGSWGLAQEVDTSDAVDIDFARVWAGTYTVCEGGNGPAGSGCSTSGNLTGANATLPRWGQAIGGTAAHEAGHTYGLSHSDDDPQSDACDSSEAGFAAIPGEDAFNKHLMPSGCNLTGADRATYRRHFSDRDYGILATNIGLSIETMHNWDLINPNGQQAKSLAIDFLSQKNSISVGWFYNGSQSPWLNPSVSGPSGTAVWKGKTYNKYRITWSSANPGWNNPSPGVVGGGAVFHIGATFTGVDFNQPDAIVIQNVTLLDGSTALALNPRLPSYDTGTLDATSNQMAIRFFPPPAAPGMRMVSATISQLPQLATIDSMVGNGAPYTRDRRPIRPWTITKCGGGAMREGISCVVARLNQTPHVSITHRVGQPHVVLCKNGVPEGKPANNGRTGDSTHNPDDEGPICAGTQRDPFPSATVYVVATFEEPSVKHFDPRKKEYITGPVTSKVFYQFAGVRHLPTRR